jgi:hypothetical protein
MQERAMTRECYIKCRVAEGMFSDEVTVYFDTVDPSSGRRSAASSIVPRRLIRRDEDGADRGRLRATCIGQTDDKTSVVLPQSTLENGPCVVVPADEVVPA